MPSFDIVSEVDIQEVRNALDQSVRELETRFDFKSIDAGFEFADSQIWLSAEEEFQIVQMLDILKSKLVKRSVDVRCLDPGVIEASGKQKRQKFSLKQGIERESAKLIIKSVKNEKLKVQTQIQGDQVRVTGKKRDDLQKVMAIVKELDLDIPIEFNNFRD
ncbi:MAG: YajQ family cyclic di-GMP-binding protein [Gammaproteobacteria bacterium]|nr:YajQ family cyclic di-GMP-binding protein [Gammaproteobacteria bacterium]